jgi:hypothetical protein
MNENRAEPAAAADRQGITAIRGSTALQTRRLLNGSFGDCMRFNADLKPGKATWVIGESGGSRGVVRNSRLIVGKEDH